MRSSTSPDAVDAEAVGDHEAGDDRLAEPPARLDHPLVGAGDRVPREHHAGGVGIEQRLDDDADARTGEEPDALAVGDRRVGVRRPPDLAQRRRVSSSPDGTLSSVRCWPAKLASAPSSSTADERTASGPAERPDRARRPARSRLPSPRATASTIGPDERDAGRDRQARPGRLARARPPSSRRPTSSCASASGTTSLTRAPSPRRRRRRRARARRRRSARSPRASRPRRGCRTRARRSPSARAGRRCR